MDNLVIYMTFRPTDHYAMDSTEIHTHYTPYHVCLDQHLRFSVGVWYRRLQRQTDIFMAHGTRHTAHGTSNHLMMFSILEFPTC